MPTDEERFAELERQVRRQGELIDALYRHFGLGLLDATESTGTPADVMEALHAGNTIEAIKLWRAHTGAGLKEAKDAVEAIARTV